jgi:hypothetical protein
MHGVLGFSALARRQKRVGRSVLRPHLGEAGFVVLDECIRVAELGFASCQELERDGQLAINVEHLHSPKPPHGPTVAGPGARSRRAE